MTEKSEEIISHHLSFPPLRGELESPDLIISGKNQLCGDQVSFTVALQGDVVSDIRFQASGCVLCRAAASVTAERVRSHRFQDIRVLEDADILQSLGGEITLRRKCALLPLYLIREGIGRYLLEGTCKIENLLLTE